MGLKYSTGDAHTVLAADLQDPPELLIELIDKWLKGEKIIIAERNSRDDPVISVFFSKVFYFFLRLFVNKNYPKNGFDLFMIDKKITEHFKNSDRDIYFPIHLISLGWPYSVIKYHRQKREAGKSQWSFQKKINASFDILLAYSSFRISKLILYLGLIIFISSIIYSIVLLYSSIFQGYRADGFVTLFLYITVFFGMFISLIGILSMQMYKILNRISKTEEAIIDFIET
jgi:dolichol-phosphate mannosyltransferase